MIYCCITTGCNRPPSAAAERTPLGSYWNDFFKQTKGKLISDLKQQLEHGVLTSNPKKARMNLFARDMMLADDYRRPVLLYDYALFEINGSRSAAQMKDPVEAHFAKHFAEPGQ
jgi:hypothetical protein